MTATRTKLVIRNAKPKDIAGIRPLYDKVYGVANGYTVDQIAGQINKFPDGQFVAEFEGQIVGHCVTFVIDSATALSQHSWTEITGGGFAARHDPDGDMLYGMDVIVDSEFRRLRIGQRFYKVRQDLCQWLELKGIVFGGRMPAYTRAKRRKANSAESPQDYLDKVLAGKIHDQVLRFQLANGFEPDRILEGYLPEDKASQGNAVLMVWRNPYVDRDQPVKKRLPRGVEAVRVATCQLQARAVKDYEEFMGAIRYFVDVASDYEADFIVFPELFTLMLVSYVEKELSPVEANERLSEYTPRLKADISDMAMRFNINIIAGSHPTRMDDGDIHNVAYVCLRDGSVHEQEKIHPTPNERYWWNIKGGDTIDVIQTDCGPIGVQICYDSEFPELSRRLADEGARIIFVPFCTDSRQGYLRVRYCAQARAIENQCFVVMSGNVGNLPNVGNMDIQYAQSCILTPCDFPFARDGIAAEASENVETLTISDINLADLSWARAEGTVRNLADRRFDLYRIEWDEAGDHPGKARPRRAPIGTHSAGGG